MQLLITQQQLQPWTDWLWKRHKMEATGNYLGPVSQSQVVCVRHTWLTLCKQLQFKFGFQNNFIRFRKIASFWLKNSCYFTTHCVTSHSVTLHYITVRCATQCYINLNYVVYRYTMLSYSHLSYTKEHYGKLRCTTTRKVAFCFVTLHLVT